MNFELVGKLYEIFPTEQKSERFRKREFIMENSSNIGDRTITDYVKFQSTGDKCDLLNKFKVGDTVKVHFNIRGNKWENGGKVSYFTNLDAWRIESQDNNPYGGDNTPPAADGFDTPPPAPEGDFNDDLPF